MQGGSKRSRRGYAGRWCDVGVSSGGEFAVVPDGGSVATLHDEHSTQLVFVM